MRRVAWVPTRDAPTPTGSVPMRKSVIYTIRLKSSLPSNPASRLPTDRSAMAWRVWWVALPRWGMMTRLSRARRGVIAGQRFGFGHVEGGGVDSTVLQGFQQGIVIDDASARGVDQYGRLFHQAQFASANHAPRLISQWHVQCHEIQPAGVARLGRRSVRQGQLRPWDCGCGCGTRRSCRRPAHRRATW